METRRATYSYAKADVQVFIDIETFEEFEFSNEQLGERRWFLKENEEYKALRLDGRLLDIVLPPQIPLKVVETAPPARSGATTSWKEAKLETGLEVMVPAIHRQRRHDPRRHRRQEIPGQGEFLSRAVPRQNEQVLRERFLVSCRAKRWECDRLAGPFERCRAPENRSKLRALQTLRAVQALVTPSCGTGLPVRT